MSINPQGITAAQRVRSDFIVQYRTYLTERHITLDDALEPFDRNGLMAWQQLLGQYYAFAKHAPDNKDVITAYTEFGNVLYIQFTALLDAGFRFDFVDFDPGYTTAGLHKAIGEKHVQIYATNAGTDYPREHPMLKPLKVPHGYDDMTVMINGADFTAVDRNLLRNDIFRAVHDVLGHGAAQSGFGPVGEWEAWRSHAATMPNQRVLQVLASETMAQYGYYLTTKTFAPQKAVLMPWDLVSQDIERPLVGAVQEDGDDRGFRQIVA